MKKLLLGSTALVVGGVMAWIVYRWAGLALLRRAWLNLETVWAASLVVAGVAACVVGGLG